MITIIDSGVGGLSIFKEVRRLLPQAPIRYYGDTAFMPYGHKTSQQIFARLTNIIQQFEDTTDVFVIACNTATVSLIQDYRRASRRPFVGIEPGIKPAAQISQTKHIAILATPRTVQSPQIPVSIKKFGNGCKFHLIACDELAEAIERAPEQINATLKCTAQIPAEADTVVLACTHYNLIVDQILKCVGADKKIIDVSAPVARQVARVYRALPKKIRPEQNGFTEFLCSGDQHVFSTRAHEILGQ